MKLYSDLFYSPLCEVSVSKDYVRQNIKLNVSGAVVVCVSEGVLSVSDRRAQEPGMDNCLCS